MTTSTIVEIKGAIQTAKIEAETKDISTIVEIKGAIQTPEIGSEHLIIYNSRN